MDQRPEVEEDVVLVEENAPAPDPPNIPTLLPQTVEDNPRPNDIRDFPGDTSIVYLQENPKRRNCKSWRRYEQYKSATTLGQARDLGATKDDLVWDFERGFLEFPNDAISEEALSLFDAAISQSDLEVFEELETQAHLFAQRDVQWEDVVEPEPSDVTGTWEGSASTGSRISDDFISMLFAEEDTSSEQGWEVLFDDTDVWHNDELTLLSTGPASLSGRFPNKGGSRSKGLAKFMLKRRKEIQKEHIPEQNIPDLQKAMKAEIDKFKSKGAIGKTIDEKEKNLLTLNGSHIFMQGRWVYTKGNFQKTGNIYKARWVIRGDLDKRKVPTACPTPSWPSTRPFLYKGLGLSHAGSQANGIVVADFSTAFLNSPFRPQEAGIIVPAMDEFGNKIPGQYWLLESKVYGLRDAPRAWYEELKARLSSLGWAPCDNEPWNACVRVDHGAGVWSVEATQAS